MKKLMNFKKWMINENLGNGNSDNYNIMGETFEIKRLYIHEKLIKAIFTNINNGYDHIMWLPLPFEYKTKEDIQSEHNMLKSQRVEAKFDDKESAERFAEKISAYGNYIVDHTNDGYLVILDNCDLINPNVPSGLGSMDIE
jgi:hypothetical protein